MTLSYNVLYYKRSKKMSEQTLDSTYTTANEFQNKLAEQEAWPEGPLKEVLINYVGEVHGDSEEVTVEMIVETMANEFPEFLMLVAEENWIRGYQQAIHDVDEGQKMLAAEAAKVEETAESDAENN